MLHEGMNEQAPVFGHQQCFRKRCRFRRSAPVPIVPWMKFLTLLWEAITLSLIPLLLNFAKLPGNVHHLPLERLISADLDVYGDLFELERRNNKPLTPQKLT